MSTAVTILILNWNGEKYLDQFLPSVLATQYDNFHILVADNGSTDGSVQLVKEKFPTVEVLELEQNYGFTTGNNKALPHIHTPYYVLLNSDVEVDPGWLAPLVEMMDGDDAIASIQPKIRAFHDKSSFEYAGAAGGYIDVLGYPFCRGRMFNHAEKDNGQYDQPAEIFWATGACCLIRKSVTDSIGLFEDSFFAHMEEIDFCWRAKNHGHKIMYCPDSIVYHVGGGTLPKTSPRKTYLNIRNSLAALFLNFPAGQMPFKLYARLVLDGVFAIKALLGGEAKLVPAIIKAHWSFFFDIPFWLKRRKERNKGIKQGAGLTTGYYKGSVVWQFFIKGKKLFSDL